MMTCEIENDNDHRFLSLSIAIGGQHFRKSLFSKISANSLCFFRLSKISRAPPTLSSPSLQIYSKTSSPTSSQKPKMTDIDARQAFVGKWEMKSDKTRSYEEKAGIKNPLHQNLSVPGRESPTLTIAVTDTKWTLDSNWIERFGVS